VPGPNPTDLERLLDAKGHVLVFGGPGSGKTTMALKKALARIQAGLRPSQAVLFLSFSRAAVARLAEAGAQGVPRLHRDKLLLQTFHGFCWSYLSCHAYLLGAPRRLQIFMPHDERALSDGIKADHPDWTAWEREREALFFREGRLAFDLFAPMMLRLVQSSPIIKRLIAQQYPLIIVDEAQDTGGAAWQIVQELKNHVQIICLADSEQQIFDHLPGVGPERIEVIQRELTPLEIDLGQQNNRSPGTEIAEFGNDLIHHRVRGAPYTGVSSFTYNPKSDLNTTLRKSLALLYRRTRQQFDAHPQSCVILAATGREVAAISSALSNGSRPVAHKVVFDEARALLTSRFAAFLLEPKSKPNIVRHVIDSLEFLASIERAAGTAGGKKIADDCRKWAAEYRAGKVFPKKGIAASLSEMICALHAAGFTGDPKSDWLRVKAAFRGCADRRISNIAGHLDYLVAFGRGGFLTANLSSCWMESGTYAGARVAFDAALAQDAIMETSQDLGGIHVMTIHRAKGKQFDGVVIVRRGVPGAAWTSSFVWRDDAAPYLRSRKILRVAITRARKHVLILNPAFPGCPLLNGHVL
jgi:ATP-dependent DNA helicase UvrD/PcrA